MLKQLDIVILFLFTVQDETIMYLYMPPIKVLLFILLTLLQIIKLQQQYSSNCF